MYYIYTELIKYVKQKQNCAYLVREHKPHWFSHIKHAHDHLSFHLPSLHSFRPTSKYTVSLGNVILGKKSGFAYAASCCREKTRKRRTSLARNVPKND